MSYILDALKKSDSERQQRQGPALASVQQQHFFYHRPDRNWGLPILVGLVVVLLCIGMWLYSLGYLQIALPTLTVSQSPADTTMLETPVATTTAEKKIEQPAPEAAPQIQPAVAPPQPQAAAQPEMVETMPTVANMRELWQLPSALRAGIPPLEFSLHVYSGQVEQRSIIINNRMMREGEFVNPELQLRTITPAGVVMRYRNEYFRVSIVDSW